MFDQKPTHNSPLNIFFEFMVNSELIYFYRIVGSDAAYQGDVQA